ncbi:MAG: class F sortase [Patescibacteria group bacterium]
MLIKTGDSRLHLALVCVGVAVALIGAADLTTRAAHAVLGDSAGAVAFGPAISLVDSSPLIPARLRIPAIGVDAAVESVGTKADGTMGAPAKFGEVAWYAPGAKPGAAGNAVFAGHVDNALTTAGVFEHLSSLKPGDYVTVADAAGKTLIYRVTSSRSYPANEAPVAQIFATSGPQGLVLITCIGEWVTSERQFDQRLVVLAAPTY